MYFGEALRVLGLDGDDGELTKERVRRTYLRKLREHPPERDPDGFARLREAYELVREYADGEHPAPLFVASEPLWNEVVARPVEPEPEPEPEPDLPEPEPPAPRPLVVSTLPPATMFAPAEPEPLSLDERVAAVLRMLQHGELDAANELAAAWREADDHRRPSSQAIVKWALARELLGVAPVLPSLVVRELARGIADGTMNGPKQALATFHAERPFDAEEANVVLARRASSVHRMIGNALARKAHIPAAYEAQTRRASSGNGRFVWIGIVVALGIARLISASHSTSPSSSSTRYPPPRIDPALFKPYQPVQLPPIVLPIPPAEFRPDQPAYVQRNQMRSSTRALIATGNARALQDEAMQLELAIDSNDCPAMRAALQRIAKLPASEDEARAQSNAEHFVALGQRIEIVCPQKTTKKKNPKR